MDSNGCVGVVAPPVVGTVGDVAGGVTLEVIIVGGGKACVLVSEVLEVPLATAVAEGNPRY